MINKLKWFYVGISILILSGCVNIPDKEGWSYNQKKQFLQLLEEDSYLSICNQQTLYEEVKQSQNSKSMSRLLVAYVENLANSCIKIDDFNAVQKKRHTLDFSTQYDSYLQDVNSKKITMQLKAGQSIQKILAPYIPEYKQFFALIKHYKGLKNTPTTKPSILKKVRLNIERIKLMKPGLGDTYVLVNIPEFKVRVIENNQKSIDMRIVVGKRHKQTPIFAAKLQSIVVNPTWNVPDSISRNEIIPKVLKNPGYLKSHRLVIRKNYNLDSPALKFDPKLAKQYVGGKGSVPFKFIEVASSRNALGRVKFLFPNHYSVYMHDTPSKHLFKKKVRAYSHGCVRLAKPVKMLHYLAKHYTNMSSKKVSQVFKSKKTTYIPTIKPLYVHTAYLTSYVQEDGSLYLFKDIYQYDLLQKLNFSRL